MTQGEKGTRDCSGDDQQNWEVAFDKELKNFKQLVFKIKIRVIIKIICIVVIFKSILSKF